MVIHLKKFELGWQKYELLRTISYFQGDNSNECLHKMEKLTEFLRYYIPQADLSAFTSCFSKKRIAKKEFLITPGQHCQFLAYIQEGCFRVFYYDTAGKEITTWFSFEKMIVTDMLAFYTGQKAFFYVEALEESLIRVISKNELEKLYQQHVAYQEFGRKFAEEALVIVMERMLELQTQTAEQRYQALLQQPAFFQKIPLKHLASYLGITDSSLSRIRRKISED